MNDKPAESSTSLGSLKYTISDYAIDPPIFHSVDRPEHYSKDGTIECIDAMVAAFGEEAVRDYCRVNAFKYVWRAHEKGNEVEDVRKGIWYLRRSIGDDPRG